MTKETQTVGEAYAFFNCNASKADIEAELPTIRGMAQTPSELELSLMEGMDSLEGDQEIRDISQEAKEAGIRYAIRAKLPNSTNERTADEVSGILNQAYQSPLYQNGERFVGHILYKKGSEYVSRD